MTAVDWSEANNRYLAASLNWLRLRLRAAAAPLAAPSAAPPAAVSPVAQARIAGRGWFGRSVTAVNVNAATTPARVADHELAAAAREEAAAVDPPPALILVAQRLGLSAFERDTLLLCAAVELDPALPALIAAAQGGQRHAPTFGLALNLFDAPTWDALSPRGVLRWSQLIEVSQGSGVALTAAALRADERIVNFLKGLNALDDRVESLVTLLPAGAVDLAGSQASVVDGILQRLQAVGTQSPLPVVQLTGIDAGSKLAVARAVAARLERRLYRIALAALPLARADLDHFVRLWQREVALLPIALYVDAEDLEPARVEHAAALRQLASRELGLVFVAVRESPRDDSGATLAVDVGKPEPGEQFAAWQHLLPGELCGDARCARLLAGQFDFNIGDIARAASQAAFETGDTAAQRVWSACRRIALPRLDTLAERLVPKASWDDLVLPADSMALLREIAGQVRERYTVYQDWGFTRRMTRGFGINALFAGDSGTGKTMAAEVLANELDLALYRIDLSAVVSKYIGETEKNLRRLFDAAESGGAILLFDEADALFGKRSEVKDSHDRYANIEINYLLQRMEGYSGLALLATNMKSALDHAFMRRLRFVVNFVFPGVDERLRIWQRALPPEVPCGDLDYARLARFNLSGGNIHSVALNAAFAAAQRNAPLDQTMLLGAVRTELRKLDKPCSEAEFR